MDKSAQIDVLRKEHKNAVDNYDFDRAELISRQIQRLRTEISREYESIQEGTTNLDMDEQREKILGDSERTNANLMEKLVELQKRFHIRYKELQARHTQQLTDLSLEHTMALERETSRPIPEVDNLLSQSKIQGREHNYQQAKALYQEAMKIQKVVNEQRRNECNILFMKAERKLKDRQARELKLLEEKQASAKEEINQQYSKHKSVLDNRMKVKEIKATIKPAVERSTMRSAIGRRRSSSVSRQRTSRLSQNNSRY
ncbi:hypothetical protein TRFO_21945 [Tritrichomonas foetus]|uniref:Uncharacterized protein n=1 Tax=Tritrichomonas foetus TaxID=1144522 RepID=A0A1J4KCR2_9EUKA|nr:hypothetical protein TRFO_21945 [Tritrichomonas foetus]|eukprot:OHT09215.1 hypothetical protein TRFO_21945 [Tritrichomonas foetus]